VYFTHVLIPSVAMSDVNVIKVKTIKVLQDLRKKLNRQSFLQKSNVVDKEEFNSAAIFFVSYRLAKEVPHLAISKMILSFRTSWPRRSYLQSGDVRRVYNKKFSFITNNVMMIVLFLIQQLMNANISIQDLLVHELSAVFSGYVVSLFLQLYDIYPALIIVPFVGSCVIIHFAIQANRRGVSNDLTRVVPAGEELPKESVIPNVKVTTHVNNSGSVVAESEGLDGKVLEADDSISDYHSNEYALSDLEYSLSDLGSGIISDLNDDEDDTIESAFHKFIDGDSADDDDEGQGSFDGDLELEIESVEEMKMQ